jgi:hypothetical protein
MFYYTTECYFYCFISREGFATSASHTNIGRLKFEELIQLMINDMDAMQPLIRIDFKNSMDDFVVFHSLFGGILLKILFYITSIVIV